MLADKFPEIANDIEYVGTLDKVLTHPGINLKHPKAKEIAKKLDAGRLSNHQRKWPIGKNLRGRVVTLYY